MTTTKPQAGAGTVRDRHVKRKQRAAEDAYLAEIPKDNTNKACALGLFNIGAGPVAAPTQQILFPIASFGNGVKIPTVVSDFEIESSVYNSNAVAVNNFDTYSWWYYIYRNRFGQSAPNPSDPTGVGGIIPAMVPVEDLLFYHSGNTSDGINTNGVNIYVWQDDHHSKSSDVEVELAINDTLGLFFVATVNNKVQMWMLFKCSVYN